ncbi:hypothetical protein PBY51_024919 [Eleginops maclovinus]|uniref:Uncharacterized protein n=1 Tax=Eleginops maclovinus TaxID=56733 RepID=A0AAN8AWC0_ELEMC|nr:hypothetical protein PBY51_024919 [Eleginops maclovinus]
MSDHFSASPLSPGFPSCFRVFTEGSLRSPAACRRASPDSNHNKTGSRGLFSLGKQTATHRAWSMRDVSARCSVRMFDSQAGQLQMSAGSAETETL